MKSYAVTAGVVVVTLLLLHIVAPAAIKTNLGIA